MHRASSFNFTEDYMRRREPDCMRIADDKPSDKKRFADVYGYKFGELRQETMEWLETGLLMPFNSGGNEYGYGSVLVCPEAVRVLRLRAGTSYGFDAETEGYKPRAVIYVAPPFPSHPFEGSRPRPSGRLPIEVLQPLSGSVREEGRLLGSARHRRAGGLDHLPYLRRPSDHAV